MNSIISELGAGVPLTGPCCAMPVAAAAVGFFLRAVLVSIILIVLLNNVPVVRGVLPLYIINRELECCVVVLFPVRSCRKFGLGFSSFGHYFLLSHVRDRLAEHLDAHHSFLDLLNI